MIMKGQFFIIATVVIIAAMIMLMQYLFDFGKTDLTLLEELNEPDYIAMVKSGFITGINASLTTGGCGRLDADLADMKDYYKTSLLAKGISFNALFDTTDCPNVDVEFNLSTNRFHSVTDFSYP